MKTNQIDSTPVAALERRPMFTRNWNISQQFANWLMAHDVPPNAISLAGMAGGIAAGLALAATPWVRQPQTMFLLAVVGIVVRGMGNLLDGMVAVGSGKASPPLANCSMKFPTASPTSPSSSAQATRSAQIRRSASSQR